MNILFRLIKLLYINKVAYAINEYHYNDKDNPKYSATYYRIEKVIIQDLFIKQDVEFMVKDITTESEWGDSTKHVYLTKRKVSKELLKLLQL